MQRAETVLVLNAGSSSLKFSVFSFESGEQRLCDGAIENVGAKASRAWLRTHFEEPRSERSVEAPDFRAALDTCFSWLRETSIPEATLTAHRVVHGGRSPESAAWLTAALLEELRGLVALSPLHMPAALAGIEHIATQSPETRQVVCFDTAFHHAMPELAKRFALPEELWAAGIQRYGFHGLSFEYALSALEKPLPARLIIAHLGNGSSLVAVRDGSPIDTTMGLTPSGGVIMGTRSGDLDPGVLLYLAREHGYSIDALERLVNRQAGLLALGGSSDMRELLDRRERDPRAALAIAAFAYSVKKAIGSLMAALGGLDALVFTGGIGENAAAVRTEICSGLQGLGVELDPERNARSEARIEAATSRCRVQVVRTDEDLMIARHAQRLAQSAR